MADYKTKVVLDFLKSNNFVDTPEELLKQLIYEDLSIFDADSVDDLEDRLKYLGSLKGLSEPQFVVLNDDESGHTDGSTILINTSHHRPRQLFTWAHEISHAYFGKSSGVTTDFLGTEYHCSGTNLEEERLCDFGASLILMYGIVPDDFSINSLLQIVRKTGASAEAVAISMSRQASSKNGIIVWRRKCKKGENPDQVSLFGEETQNTFRIDYAFSKNIYLPNNKSVDEGNFIDLCGSDLRSSGVIGIKLNNIMVKFMSDNLNISDGRVLTLFQLI